MDIVIQPLKRTIVLQADNPRQDITLINQSRPIVAEQKPPAVDIAVTGFECDV